MHNLKVSFIWINLTIQLNLYFWLLIEFTPQASPAWALYRIWNAIHIILLTINELSRIWLNAAYIRSNIAECCKTPIFNGIANFLLYIAFQIRQTELFRRNNAWVRLSWGSMLRFCHVNHTVLSPITGTRQTSNGSVSSLGTQSATHLSIDYALMRSDSNINQASICRAEKSVPSEN